MTKNSKTSQIIKNAIENGHIQMRSKWYFLKRKFITYSGIIIAGILSIFIVSLITYILQQTGIWEATHFGKEGIQAFIIALPWILIVTALIFILILEVLMKHFAFSYRKPLLYSAVFIITTTLLSGYAFAQSDFHEKIEILAEKNNITPLQKAYEIARPIDKLHIGQITKLNVSGFTIETNHEDILEVHTTSTTKYKQNYQPQAKDFVSVFGQRIENDIHAKGIKRINNQKIEKRIHHKKQIHKIRKAKKLEKMREKKKDKRINSGQKNPRNHIDQNTDIELELHAPIPDILNTEIHTTSSIDTKIELNLPRIDQKDEMIGTQEYEEEEEEEEEKEEEPLLKINL